MRPSRLNMDEQKARLHCRNVENILSSIDFDKLLDPDIVFTALNRLCRSDKSPFSPGTKYSILISYRRMLNYLLEEFPFAVDETGKIHIMLRRVEEWLPKIAAQRSARRAQVWIEDTANLAKIDISLAFNNTACEKARSCLIDEYSTDPCLIEARNYVLLRLFAENATRSGAPRLMTVGDVLSATVSDTNADIILIASHQHKTVQSHSCAFISASRELYDLLKLLATRRSKELSAQGKKEDDINQSTLFVNIAQNSHGEMSSSNIVVAINQAYGKLGGRGHLTPTLTRKRAARMFVQKPVPIRESPADVDNNNIQTDMARAMSHTLSTHQRYYAGNHVNEEVTRRNSSRLHDFLRENRDVKPVALALAETESERDADMTLGRRKRQNYSEAEERIINKAFAKFYDSANEKLTLGDVVRAIDSNAKLQSIVNQGQRSARKIYDKVRQSLKLQRAG